MRPLVEPGGFDRVSVPRGLLWWCSNGNRPGRGRRLVRAREETWANGILLFWDNNGPDDWPGPWRHNQR